MSPSPPLHILGIELPVSADEVGIPAKCGAIIRGQFVLVNILLLLLVNGTVGLTECTKVQTQDDLLVIFSAISLGILSMSFVNYAVIYNRALQGSIFEPEKRRMVSTLLYSLLFLYTIEIGLACFGSWIAIIWDNNIGFDNIECEEIAYQKLALLFAWLAFLWIDVFLFVCLSISIVTRPARRAKRVQGYDFDDYETSEVHWRACCKSWMSWIGCLSCGFAGKIGGEEVNIALESAAEVFSRFFTGHDLNRSSDVLVGLILLRAEQKRRKSMILNHMWAEGSLPLAIEDPHRKFSIEVNNYLWNSFNSEQDLRLPKTGQFPDFDMKSSGTLIEKTDSDSVEQIENLIKYAPYSLGINGFPIKLLLDLKYRRTCSLGKTFFPCCDTTFENDCFFGINSSAFMSVANVKPEDVLYASWNSKEAKVVPHAIVVSHELRSIIVTCQGTQDLAGALTDVMIHPQSLTRTGKQWGFDGEGDYCHSGFLSVAETIRNAFQTHKILHKILGVTPTAKPTMDFSTGEVQIDIDGNTSLPNCIGYDLILVGHSLGAGISSVLSLLLKPEFPSLKCIAYSAPGCVFSKQLAEKSQDWILMAYAGKDVVPHLSWRTLSKLRGQLIEMLRRSKANKNTILRSTYIKTPIEKLLYSEMEVPDTPERARLLEQVEKLARLETTDVRKSLSFQKIKMYPPGRIMHFARTKQEKKNIICCSISEPEFTAAWVNDREEMDDIIVSPQMFMDHFKVSPDFLSPILENLKNKA